MACLHHVQCHKFASIPVSHPLASPSLPIDLTLKPFLFHQYPTNVIRSLQIVSLAFIKYSAFSFSASVIWLLSHCQPAFSILSQLKLPHKTVGPLEAVSEHHLTFYEVSLLYNQLTLSRL